MNAWESDRPPILGPPRNWWRALEVQANRAGRIPVNINNLSNMGARTNIEMKYKNGQSVFIYSHWGGGQGGSLRPRLKKALGRGERHDDEMYLAAIILREVLRDELDHSTGTGVQPYPGEEQYSTTVVDMAKQTVDGVPFKEWTPESPQG